MDNAKFNRKGKYVGRTTTGLVADKNFKAMGSGERTSHTSSLITKADGSRFRRKNANQYGNAEGGNDYTETRPDRSDKFKKGATIIGFTKDKVFTKGDIAVQRVGGSDMWEVAIKGKKMGRIHNVVLSENALKKAEKEFKDKYAKGSTIKSGKKKATKKPKEPKIVRSYFEDESFEYGKGGNAGKTCEYTIGGL